MRLLIASALLLLCSFPGTTQGIEFFHGTWEEALQLAEKQDKLIFVDAYASWCGPCKRMSANVFPDARVGEFYNENFVCLKLDMEKDEEGIRFRKKYPVSAFPTLFYIDFTGEVVQQVRGAQMADQFIETGKQALAKVDRSALYATEYEQGSRDPKLVYNYIKALNKVGKPSLKITNDYLRPQSDLTTEDNLRIILEGATEADSKVFELLIEHQDKIAALTSREAVRNKILDACQASAGKAIEYRSLDLLEQSQKLMKKYYPEKAEAFSLNTQMDFSLAGRDVKTFLKVSGDYLKKIAGDDEEAYSRISNMITASFSTDARAMEKAEEYAGVAARLSNSYEKYFAYATILNNNGKKEKALEAAQKCLELARPQGQAATRMVEIFIQKIQEG